MTRTRYVGQAVERLEDLRLLTGRGQFVDDLHCEGLLHAAIYRSNVAHGRIVSIDATGGVGDDRCACGCSRPQTWVTRFP